MYRYLLSADLINIMVRLWQYKNIQDRYDHVPSKVGQRCVSKPLQHIISYEKTWRDEHGQLWEPDGNNQSTDGQTSDTGRCDIYFESKHWWVGFSKMKGRKRKLLLQRTDKHLGNNKSNHNSSKTQIWKTGTRYTEWRGRKVGERTHFRAHRLCLGFGISDDSQGEITVGIQTT